MSDQCGGTYCRCGECVFDGEITFASEEYLAKHPDVVVRQIDWNALRNA